jgi:D-arabinose 1-dehydrogenase-like Zn-dependent alcohol dehydrogenase
MSSITVKQCPRCGKTYSKTKGHEFQGEPVSNLETIKAKLVTEGHRVRIYLNNEKTRDCSDCAEYKKELAKGGPSRIHQGRRNVADDDANGSWGNAVRTREDS